MEEKLRRGELKVGESMEKDKECGEGNKWRKKRNGRKK